MKRLRALLALSLLAASSPSAAAAQTHPLGPLTAEEGAPLQRLGFTPSVEGAPVTPRGRVRAELWMAYGNVWEQDSSAVAHVFLDLERLITAATVRVGLGGAVEVGLRATLERTGGGFLDGVVTGLHGAIGAGDRNRHDFPTGRYAQWLRDGEGTLLVEIPSRSRPTLEDVRLFAKWEAASRADGSAALALKGAARLPTADNLRGAERADVALSLLGHAAWREWVFHAMAAGTTVRRSPEMQAVLRPTHWSFMAGVERPLHAQLSVVVQATGSTQLLSDLGDHDVDGAPTNLVLGLVGRAGTWRWELALQEDVPARGPSTDFTIQFGVGRTW